MRAALLVRPGEVVVDEIPDPVVGPDDVAIAVGGILTLIEPFGA